LNCNTKGLIYTYKTIDSRVYNISPTWDQISDIEFYKFKENSDLETFYNNTIKSIYTVQQDIIAKNQEFSGSNNTDMTGVVSKLAALKSAITTINNGLTQIDNFSVPSITSYNATQIAQLVQTWTDNNITTNKVIEISGRIQNINQGLEELRSFIEELSINNTTLLFDDIITTE